MKTLHFSIIALLLPLIGISGMAFGQSNANPPPLLTIWTDKPNYGTNDTVTVSGFIDKTKIKFVHDLEIAIYNPNGAEYKGDYFEIDQDGRFSYQFKLMGEQAVSGQYSVRVWSLEEPGMDVGVSFYADITPTSYFLDVNQSSTQSAYSGDMVNETIEYYITVKPNSAGLLVVNIFKNNHYLRTDSISTDSPSFIDLQAGKSRFYYKFTASGKRDQDEYELEFKYNGQKAEKIVPISSPSSNGTANIPYNESPKVTASLAKINVTFNTNSSIVITGTVYKLFSQIIVLTILNPQRQLISVSQLQPASDGSFSQSLIPSSSLWSQQGNYTVRVASGSQNLTEMTFYFPGIGCCKSIHAGLQAKPGMVIESPLQQFKSGIAVENVKCRDDLVLIIKKSDGSPTCVRPGTAQKLVERGWAQQIITSTSSGSSTQNQTQAGELEIKFSNQTYEAGYPVDARLNFTTMAPHCELPPFLVRNLSDQSIVYGPYPGWNYTSSTCSDYSPMSFYAGLEKNALITHDQRYSLETEAYGKKYEKEITVIPSEYSGRNLTAESNSILPGLTQDFLCPAFLGSRSTDTILNSSGFDGVYHRYFIRISHSEEVDNYFLKPGHNGTIVLKVHRGSAFAKDENLAEGLGFFNSQSSQGNFEHKGIAATFSPNPAIAGSDDYATFDIIISTTQDAAHGTYWVYLPPGACGGGDPIFLTVGDKPLAQPPDLLGYDLSVDFSFSESPVLTVNAGNPSIHTFDDCSLTYTGENKTSLLNSFDTIAPGFSYKYHFDSNPVKGDKVTFECTSPHIARTYSPR